MRILVLTVLAAFAAAQQTPLPTPLPTLLPPDLEALSKRVDAAHHPKGPTAPVTAFAGELELHPLAPGEDHAPQVDLAVRYLQSPKPGTDTIRHLIRYKVRDAGQRIERGCDRYGFWQLKQGKASDLTEADPTYRASAERDTALARQLVRFLEPGAALRQLTAPGPVGEEVFKLGREPVGIACQTVEGGLAAFPLLQIAGEDAPVHMKIYVTKAEGRLLAIKAWPLVKGERVEAGAEFVRLLDLREADGLLMPHTLEHLFADAEGKMRLQSRTLITKESLRPKLSESDFDRSRPWPD